MKTKHLLFAAALPLAFAACQNEEFESAGSAELSKDQRPLVEVKLNFQKEGADTRVSYDGIYHWQSTDKIGAFLMDEIASNYRPFGATADEWAKESWLQHYKLVDYIHTDYPFSWNTTTQEWTAPSKLQEGNYFFACPYETYEGQRQLVHYLDGQTQTGGTEADMNLAIAKNQYFVGYGQVKAGTGNKEAIKEVIMAPVLAPVKVTLRNIGTKSFDVEKVVIRGAQVATALTVDPTDAQYGGTDEKGAIVESSKYNLATGKGATWVTGEEFNYANLLGSKYASFKEDEYTLGSGDFVYAIESGATDYSQSDALRQTVKASYSEEDDDDVPNIEKQAILSFSKPITIASKGEINFAVMVNTIPEVDEHELFMDIITTQGRITDIDLTVIKEKEADGDNSLKPNTVITSNKIESLKPGVTNELTIQFDNNSVVPETSIDIQDEATLLAFIKWNQGTPRVNTATLLKDVTLTKEMYTILTSSANKGILKVTSENDSKLLVADDVPVDVLNVLDKTTDATVVLNGTRTLTKAVADKLVGAKMTIENQGTLNVAEAEVVANAEELVNYGTIKVAKDASLKGTENNKITNYGMIENLGGIYNVKNNVEGEAKGWIKTSTGDNHIAENEVGATIQLTNIKGTYTVVAGNKGTIYYETAAGVKASELNDQKVTKLNVTGGTITLDDKDATTVTDLTIKGGTVVVKGVNAKNESAYHKFTKVEKASIDGNVTFDYAGITSGKVVAEEGAGLTFSGKNATLNLPDVTFIKGATVNVTIGTTVEAANLVWNGNSVTNLGTFQYTGNSINTPVVKAGNQIAEKTTTPPATPVNVTIGTGTSEYANLAALAEAVEDGLVIKSITISTALEVVETDEDEDELDENDYSYLKSLAAGKEVKLGANLSGLKKSMGISFGKLTVTAAATISGDANQPLLSILTVDDIDISAAKLTIENGRVKLNEVGKQGAASEHVYGVDNNRDGTITDSTESFYYQDKWIAF